MSATAVRKDVVYAISFAHMLNDWYMNLIPILTPFLLAAGFGIGEVSFAISAFTVTSSLSQPLIGYMVDRKNQSWMIYVGTAWLAALLSCIGLTRSAAMGSIRPGAQGRWCKCGPRARGCPQRALRKAAG